MTPAPAPARAASILVVDDLPANLRLLTDMLQAHGYKVRPVPNGGLALQAAAREVPDLILLDINMPGLNGYDVCERLKQDPALAAIPVIFITARDETMDKVKGFGLGAVDYITKPFQFEEVEARVRTHLEVARLRRELQRQNLYLEEAVAQRTRDLAAAHARLAILDQAKTDLLSLIAHELRTPLCGIFGTAEILLDKFAADPDAAEFSDMYEQSRRRLMTLIDDALLFTQIGAEVGVDARQLCALGEVLTSARSEAETFARPRNVTIAPVPPDLGAVSGARNHLLRALQALLETAVKFAHPGNTVRLRNEGTSGGLNLIIEADGMRLPPEDVPRFFSLLAIAHSITPGGDLGLAPALAERIVTLYGGAVSVESLSPPGIRLSVRLKTSEAGDP